MLIRVLVLFATTCLAGSLSFGSVGRADELGSPPNGDAVIRGTFGESEIVIRTTNRLAGAIDSLQWGGTEFIDSYDHGRQLQSAASFDFGSPQEFCPECFNPTEAGSRADGPGPQSSSRLLELTATEDELRTTTQMAFWLAPGDMVLGMPALNTQVLSDHLVSKRVRIGHKQLPNVIEYEVTFRVPENEQHHYAQFEALTGYMPPEFERFWAFQPISGTLAELSDGPGEQEYPIVFANAEGTYAMGVFSPDQPSIGFESVGYGRFRFKEAQVVKWNCVFRERNNEGIAPGERQFRLFVAVGTLEDVRQALVAVVAEYGDR